MNGNQQRTASSDGRELDVVVIGAGFAGLYSLHQLREMGFSAQVVEKADDVGGTWYYNRYPGARCDTESHVYCYSFSDELLDEWEYSERYPEQPEIREYLRYVADRLDLRRDIQFNTEVESATFDEDSGVWTIGTNNGSQMVAQHLILAVGPLSEPYVPDFEGFDTFDGDRYHTATWPHDPVDFGGQSVAVIGTGSSGIQSIPRLAERADRLTVYQRTPNYAIPARNHPLSDDDWDEIREHYDEIWERAWNTTSGHPFQYRHESVAGLSDEEIAAALEERWQEGGFRFFLTFSDLLSNEETNEVVSEFIREKIRERLDDPDLVEKLVPENHPYGTKRPPLDYEDYYETYERGDVELVDVRDAPIERITQAGIETVDSHREHDAIVLATGFDAITGAFTSIDLQGRNGTSLESKWDGNPRSYLGLAIDEFPNMFLISGPQSPSVITNQPVAIEQQVEWIADCLDHMRTRDFEYIETRAESVEGWVEHTNEVAGKTLYPDATSWYKGDNIPGKPHVFLPYPGGFNNFRDRCAEIAERGYEGFRLAESIEQLGYDEAEL